MAASRGVYDRIRWKVPQRPLGVPGHETATGVGLLVRLPRAARLLPLRDVLQRRTSVVRARPRQLLHGRHHAAREAVRALRRSLEALVPLPRLQRPPRHEAGNRRLRTQLAAATDARVRTALRQLPPSDPAVLQREGRLRQALIHPGAPPHPARFASAHPQSLAMHPRDDARGRRSARPAHEVAQGERPAPAHNRLLPLRQRLLLRRAPRHAREVVSVRAGAPGSLRRADPERLPRLGTTSQNVERGRLEPGHRADDPRLRGQPSALQGAQNCRVLDGRSLRPLLAGGGTWPRDRAVLAEIKAGTSVGTNYSAIRTKGSSTSSTRTARRSSTTYAPTPSRRRSGRPAGLRRGPVDSRARLRLLATCSGLHGPDACQ